MPEARVAIHPPSEENSIESGSCPSVSLAPRARFNASAARRGSCRGGFDVAASLHAAWAQHAPELLEAAFAVDSDDPRLHAAQHVLAVDPLRPSAPHVIGPQHWSRGPACAGSSQWVTVWRTLMAFISRMSRLTIMRRSPAGHSSAPETLVPPPNGMTTTSCSFASRTSPSTCSCEPGHTTKSGTRANDPKRTVKIWQHAQSPQRAKARSTQLDRADKDPCEPLSHRPYLQRPRHASRGTDLLARVSVRVKHSVLVSVGKALAQRTDSVEKRRVAHRCGGLSRRWLRCNVSDVKAGGFLDPWSEVLQNLSGEKVPANRNQKRKDQTGTLWT